MKKQSTRMAEDMWEKIGHSTLTMNEIMQHTGRSRDWLNNRLAKIKPMNPESQKKFWFYEDVAKAICGEL